jgi:hypothetical protein
MAVILCAYDVCACFHFCYTSSQCPLLTCLPAAEYPTTDSLLQLNNFQAGGRLTQTFYSSLHWLANWSSQIVPLITSRQDRTENTTPNYWSSIFPWGRLFAMPLLSNGYYIFAYLLVVSSQRIYMLQYCYVSPRKPAYSEVRCWATAP